MFAKTMNRLSAWFAWWRGRSKTSDGISERKLLTNSGGGPGCPPLPPAAQDSSDALALMFAFSDRLLTRDLALAAMVESMKPARAAWLKTAKPTWMGVDLAKPEPTPWRGPLGLNGGWESEPQEVPHHIADPFFWGTKDPDHAPLSYWDEDTH